MKTLNPLLRLNKSRLIIIALVDRISFQFLHMSCFVSVRNGNHVHPQTFFLPDCATFQNVSGINSYQHHLFLQPGCDAIGVRLYVSVSSGWKFVRGGWGPGWKFRCQKCSCRCLWGWLSGYYLTVYFWAEFLCFGDGRSLRLFFGSGSFFQKLIAALETSECVCVANWLTRAKNANVFAD